MSYDGREQYSRALMVSLGAPRSRSSALSGTISSDGGHRRRKKTVTPEERQEERAYLGRCIMITLFCAVALLGFGLWDDVVNGRGIGGAAWWLALTAALIVLGVAVRIWRLRRRL